jgi:hypothetical protein
MLLPKLTNCVDCSSIPALLADINCKLAELANNLYNNTVFSLNRSIKSEVTFDLINYKRILLYRVCNIDYGNYCDTNISLEMIASRVKLLIHK